MFMVSNGGDHAGHSDFWFNPVGASSGGVLVTPDSAMRIGTVYACVRVRAETMGTMPLILYRRKKGGGKERATEHPLYHLLAKKPNPWQTAFEWRAMTQAHVDLRGNAYSRIVYAGPGVSQLVPMHPDHVKPEWVPSAQRMRYRWTSPDRPEVVLGQDEVLHLRGLETDGFLGLNPIEINRRSLAATMATTEFGRRFFENDGTPGGWIQHPTQFKDKESRDKWRASWREQQTGANRGQTAVLEYGMTYHEVGVKNTDAQFLETRRADKLEICQMFRMPPHKVGILDDAKWANIEQQAIDFLTDTVLPSATNWEQRLDDGLLSEAEQGEYFFEYLLDGLQRGDSAARAAYYDKALTKRWMVPNEVRAAENLNPMPWGNDPLPLPNESVGSDGGNDPDAPDEPPPPPPPADEQDTEEDAGASARAALIEQRTAETMAGKEVQAIRALAKRAENFEQEISAFYNGEFQGLLQRALVIDEQKAKVYLCQSMAELTDAHNAGRLNVLLDSWKHSRADCLLSLIHSTE